MATAGEIAILIKANNQAQATLRQFEDQVRRAEAAAKTLAPALDRAAASANSMSAALKSAAAHAGGIGGALSSVVSTAAGFAVGTLAIGGLSKAFAAGREAVVGYNDSIDKVRLGFTSMLGSAQQADDLVRDLAAFAKATPFEFEGLAKTSQLLVQVGFSAKDVIPTMTAVGDAVSAAGRSAESVDRVVLALSQIAAKGRLSAEELNQLTEAGVAGLPILAQQMGKTTGEISGMIERGLIPADQALKMLITGMEQRAPGAMDKMSHTWTGAISNIKDGLTQASSQAFRPFFDLLVQGANKFADFLSTERFQAWVSLVSGAFRNLSNGIQAIFGGDNARAAMFFQNFADQAGRAAQQVELAFLRIADALMPAVEPITRTFVSLVTAAVGWGADLITSFTSGLISAAGSVLSQALSSIFDFIASWFPHSPAQRGPFKDIYLFGADLLHSLFTGMSQADFGMLDTVMGSVKDALQAQLNLGDFGKEGLIPRLMGSEAGVAQALAELQQVGQLSEQTIDLLNSNLGEAAGTIMELIQNVVALGKQDAAIAALTTQIDEWDRRLHAIDADINVIKRQMDDLRRKYDDQRRPLEDSIYLTDRFYNGLIANADKAIAKIDEQIRAMERLRQPLYDALDEEERGLNLNEANRRLGEAQNAHLTRQAQLARDVAAAQQAVADAQHRAATSATTDPYERAALARSITEAQTRLQEAQQRLNAEGHQTDADRLAINRARRDVAQAQLAIDTAGLHAERTQLETDRTNLETARNNATADAKAALEAINDEERTRLRVLDEQLKPLQDQRQAAQDSRDALADQRQLLEDARTPLDEAIKLTQTRLSHDRDITEQYRQQLDLLNQMAEAAAKGAGGGGAGGLGRTGVGLGPGGLGLPRPGGGGNVDRTQSFQDVEAMAAEASKREDALNAQMEALGKKIKAQFVKSVREGLQAGFDGAAKDDLVFAGLGAAVGLYFGGPFGALVGAAVGVAIGRGLEKVDWGGLLNSGNIKAFITTTIPAWFDGLGPLIDRALRASGHLAEVIVNWFKEEGAPAMLRGLGFIVAVIALFPVEVAKRTPDILKGLWALLGEITTWIVETALPEIAGGLHWWSDALWTWIKEVWPQLQPAAAEFMGRIEEWLGDRALDILEWAGELGLNLVKGIWHGIEDAWDGFIDWLVGLWNGMLKAVRKLLGVESPSTVFAEIGRDLLRGLMAGLAELWVTVRAWFTDLPGNIVTAVNTVTETLKTKGLELLGGFWKGVTDLWESSSGVRQWFEKLAGKVLTALGDAVAWGNTLYSRGQALIQGLWDGAVNVWGRVETWLGDRARQAAAALDPRNYVPHLPKLTDGGGGLLGPDKMPLPTAAGWGGVAHAGIKTPTGGGGLGSLSGDTTAALAQLGNDDAFLRWLSTQSDESIRSAGYDPAGLRRYAAAMGWGGGSTGAAAPPTGSTATWAYPTTSTQIGGGGGSEGGNAVSPTPNALGVPGLSFSTVTEPGKTPLTTVTFHGQSWGFTGVPSLDDVMHMLGFTNPQAFAQWLAALGQLGPWTGEGQGLFGSNVGDVQSLLDILSPNPTHHAQGGLTTGDWAITSEKGPELLNLPRGTRVFSNTDSRTFMSAAAKMLRVPGFADGGTVGGGMYNVPVIAGGDEPQTYTDQWGTKMYRIQDASGWRWVPEALYRGYLAALKATAALPQTSVESAAALPSAGGGRPLGRSSGGSGDGLTIVIQGDVYDAERFGEKVDEIMRRRQQRRY